MIMVCFETSGILPFPYTYLIHGIDLMTPQPDQLVLRDEAEPSPHFSCQHLALYTVHAQQQGI